MRIRKDDPHQITPGGDTLTWLLTYSRSTLRLVGRRRFLASSSLTGSRSIFRLVGRLRFSASSSPIGSRSTLRLVGCLRLSSILVFLLFGSILRFVKGFLQLLPRLKMRLPPRRDINDLTRLGITSGWFGFRIPRFEDTESPHFDAVPFDQSFPHGLE